MATSIQYSLLNSTSSSPPHPTFEEARKNPPPKFSRFSQKPIKVAQLKGIHQDNFKESFIFLSEKLSQQNSPQSCVNEAYSSLLELCASRNALSQGQQVHAHFLKSAAAYDEVFLSTKLVFVYGKCGSVLDAEKVFYEISERTIFTWNAMIGAYVTHGEPFRALELFSHGMHDSGVPLDAHTFASVLKACGENTYLSLGTQMHGLVIKLGFGSNVFVTNSLMGMYTKCSDLDAIMLLFGRLKEKDDAVSWNSVISAYSANGQSLEALRLFREMRKGGVTPSTYTFVAVLQACDEPSYSSSILELHAAILKFTHSSDMYVANALVVAYTRCGRMGEAAKAFSEMDEKDNISWNSMLSGLVQNGLYYEALQSFHEMQRAGLKPDQCTILILLTTSGRLGNLSHGTELHAYAIKNIMETDLQVENTLIDMYAKCRRLNYMDTVFSRMSFKDFVSWTTIITGCAQNNCDLRAIHLFREVQMEGMHVDPMMVGSVLLACSGLKCIPLVQEIHGYIVRRGLSDHVLENTLVDVYGWCGYIHYASRVFELIKVKDVVSWTSMISCYLHNELAYKALCIFSAMEEADIEPDSITLVSILSAAADLSALRKGREIHGFLIRKGFNIAGSLASSLVDMYACCGNLENSIKVFNCVGDKDLVLWTSMMNAYGMHGDGKAAISIFERMEDERVFPDHISFLALLYACSHSALVDEGKKYFDKMQNEYNLEPWPQHYACLVDLLGRANYLDEAFQFVKSMQMQPTSAVWCALLGACRIHSNKELGDFAAMKLLELDPANPGNYVLVSNVYAATGRWEDVDVVRRNMKVKGLKKDPACSWIEIMDKVHTFIARDRSHPESGEIYQKLAQITERLETQGGYVADTKHVLHNVDEKEKVKMLYGHSERLAMAYGLLKTPKGIPIRITKNLRVCDDCHTYSKLVSKFFEREIIVRDAKRFHHFCSGVCSCGDFW